MKISKGQSTMARPLAAVAQRIARSRVLRAVAAANASTAVPHKTINVMTYNILAQKYAQSGWHNYCQSRHLNWEYRKALLLAELEEYGSDIICLQEVEAEVFLNELQPWLAERGYRGHYLARQYGENVQGPPEGVALFYRTDVFELLQQRSFIFSSVPTQPPAPLAPSLSSSDGEEAGNQTAEATATPASAVAAAPAAAVMTIASGGAVSAASTSEAGSDAEPMGTDSDVEEVGAGPGTRREAGGAAGPRQVLGPGGSQVQHARSIVTAAVASSSSSSARRSSVIAAAAVAVSSSREAEATSRGDSHHEGGSGGDRSRATNGPSGSSSSGSSGGDEATVDAARRSQDSTAAPTSAASSPPGPVLASTSMQTSLDEEPPPVQSGLAKPRDSGNSGTSGRSSSTTTSSSSSSGRSRPGGGRGRGNNEFWSVFLRRREGAIMALLRHRPSQRPMLAAVTHLFWNPAFPDVKAFQAAVLCQEMAAFLRKYTGGEGTDGSAAAAAAAVPVILAGDFNSLSRKRVPDVFDPKIPRGPDGLVSGVYTLLTRGSLPPDHPDHPASRRRPGETSNPDFRGLELTTAGIKLASAYSLANGSEPPLTTRTATFAGCLDYIFLSPQHFEVVSTLELPYEESAPDTVRDPLADVEFAPIPNSDYPSDHLSLVALLGLKG